MTLGMNEASFERQAKYLNPFPNEPLLKPEVVSEAPDGFCNLGFDQIQIWQQTLEAAFQDPSKTKFE